MSVLQALDHEMVKNLEERLRAAMVAHDIASLDELYHPAIVLLLMWHGRFTKADLLALHPTKVFALTRLAFVDTPRLGGRGVVVNAHVRAQLEGTLAGKVCDGIYPRPSYAERLRLGDQL